MEVVEVRKITSLRLILVLGSNAFLTWSAYKVTISTIILDEIHHSQ